jgi:hypothetical protein
MTRKSKHAKRTLINAVPQAAVTRERARDEGDGSLSSPLRRLWAGSRSSAVAGRGNRYQDLVGAWVALRVLTADIGAGRVLTEGSDERTHRLAPWAKRCRRGRAWRGSAG